MSEIIEISVIFGGIINETSTQRLGDLNNFKEKR